jgi:succinate dehydrogenase / fumarate reductase cytochrome b subunit
MILASRLKLRSVAARPVGYVCHATVQASLASRTMILTGLVIFAFIAFHLAHYTLGVVHGVTIPKGETVVVATVASDSNTPINRPQKLPVDVTLNYLELRDAQGRHDVHAMMYHGFRNPLIVALYVVAQLVLFFHLWHGVGSMFQSLGLNTPRLHRAVRRLAMLVASGVLAGNLSVLAGAWWWTTPPAWPRFQADAAGHPTIPFWTP